jgi:hypothetical protein
MAGHDILIGTCAQALFSLLLAILWMILLILSFSVSGCQSLEPDFNWHFMKGAVHVIRPA